MIKKFLIKLGTGLFVLLLSYSVVYGVASAATTPTSGCFDNTGATIACPPSGTEDTNGDVMVTNANCYTYTPPAQTNEGVSGNWAQVECNNLATAIPAGGTNYSCGGASDRVYTSIDLGCTHKGNPITDLVFAIIRLLSDGVGIIVIASVIVGGIQYTTSGGDPNATAKAMGRIKSALTALLIFIFAYAILNYVVPGTFFGQ